MRRPGWETTLMHWYREVRERPFEWGLWDCALAAADAVAHLTGVDHAAELRGRYHDAKGALRILKAAGHASLADLVSNVMGEPLATPKLAGRGDLVLCDTEQGPALLVCMGAFAVGPGPAGAVKVAMQEWLQAWRVG